MFPIKNRDMHEILMLYFTTYIHTPVKLYPVIKTMDFHLISYNNYMFNTTALNLLQIRYFGQFPPKDLLYLHIQ